MYTKQIALKEIGSKGQEKLKNASVLIVGVGGLGSPVAEYLVRAGIGKIGLVDDDIISVSNLNRQTLYSYYDIGKKKVDIAKKRINEINPHCKIETYDLKFDISNSFDIARGYNIIIDGCDNNNTRYVIDFVSKSLNIPYVYGAISEFNGQVSVFNYSGAKSYSDVFPKDNSINKNSNSGVLGVLSGIVGSIEAMEAIKIICNIGSPLINKLLIIEFLSMNFTIFDINI